LPSFAGTAERDNGRATLTFNAQGHFECRWVTLKSASNTCVWTKGLDETIYCPIAHGEGRFVPADDQVCRALWDDDRVALTYADGNPNGSVDDIAGICDRSGLVLGLMPHPERLADKALSGTDGAKMFLSLVETLH